jgi:hypothetical protein
MSKRFGTITRQVSDSDSDSDVENQDKGLQNLAIKKTFDEEGKTSVESISPQSVSYVSTGEEKITQMEVLGVPYPYFYHTWPSFLFENTEDVKEVFHIDNSRDDNIFIWNNQLNSSNTNEKCTNFLEQHSKYGNSLQNYYTVVNQTGNLPESWQSTDRMNITDITPIYLQKCENIMTTLLFMPLDQCHDFRGGRTSDSTSWVTMSKKGVLKSNVKEQYIQQGITSNIYSNNFMNTLVNTSFSGMKDIVGIMVISDNSLQLLKQSEYFVNETLNFQNIMLQLGIDISLGNDLYMNCNSGGNRKEFEINGEKAYVIFLGFTSDGWDKGMHDVWSMNEKKHIFSIKIDKIIRENENGNGNGALNITYSGNKITTIDNIVPCYEIIYKNMDKTGFINGYELNQVKINSNNINSLFESNNFNTFYENLLSELYRTNRLQIQNEDDNEGEMLGGSETDLSSNNNNVEMNSSEKEDTETDFLYRGATYRFYGVRAPDSKLLSQLSSVDKTLNITYESIFIEVLKKISKNIYPQIHSSFEYPEITDIAINDDTNVEQLNDRINKVNTLFQEQDKNIMSQYPISYDETKYNELEQLETDCEVNTNQNKFIIKQFGTVNDMNIAPTIDRVMNSLNCSNNCDIINLNLEEDEVEVQVNQNDINKLYPYRFQLVSGVLDSSLQGGENMPEYFPPEIDIFMTIFDNNGELQGIIVRMTFLETILRNSANTKNSAKVFSHFTYLGFDEIDLTPISTQLGENWKSDVEKYPLALKQLLDYVIKNTAFVLSRTEDLVTKFDTKLKDGNYRNWYYYYSDNVGPSVSEGINNVVIKIFNGSLGIIKDNNVDISESIVKVAQKIYADCPQLNSIFIPSFQNLTIKRSYEFESIFLLRIKYIGDKSRCTDSLFLNRNKFAECMQITGDENAYFTALINGASTIFSPPSKFAMYFAPYFTYGDVNSEGNFLLNLPVYKETLLKGESPTGFKSTSKGKSKKIDTSSSIPIISSFMRPQGITLWEDSKNLLGEIRDLFSACYGDCLMIIQNLDENVRQQEDDKKKSKYILNGLKKLKSYNSYYEEIKGKYDSLIKDKNDLVVRIKNLNNDLTKLNLPYVPEYYNNIIQQLNLVLVLENNDYQVQQVELSSQDYDTIKNYIIQFLNNGVNEMTNTLQQPSITQNVSKSLPLAINEYKKFSDKFSVLEDSAELSGLLIELKEYYFSKVLPTPIVKNVPWDNIINNICDFVSSLKDISSVILPIARQCKQAYYDQEQKYQSLNSNTYISELDSLKPKKIKSEPIPMTTPLQVVKRPVKPVSAPPIMDNTIDTGKKRSNVTFESAKPAKRIKIQPVTAESDEDEMSPTLGGGSIEQESYRKNQIYILKCFSEIIQSNDSKFNNLITSDKSNINYVNIDNIDKYCLSLLMLQIYYYFNGYQPKLDSIQNIINDISVLNEEKSSLNEAVGIRNHYSPIIDNYIEIEYLQISAADYLLSMNGCEILDRDDVIYELFNGCQISYYILEFIMTKLRSINTTQNTLLNDTTSKNFGVISQIFDIIENIDVDMMSIYYDLDKYKEQLNSSTKFSDVEKGLYKEQISTVNSYEYLCLFFIKYCNELFISLTNNQLNYSTNGLLYDYSSLLTEISNDGFTDLVDKVNSININLNANIQNMMTQLINLSETEDLNLYIKNTIDIISPINSSKETMQTSQIYNVNQSKNVAKGFSPIYYNFGQKPFKVPQGSLATQAAGTFKYRNNKKHKKTKNNNKKKINKKITIRKSEDKRKQYTKKH